MKRIAILAALALVACADKQPVPYEIDYFVECYDDKGALVLRFSCDSVRCADLDDPASTFAAFQIDSAGVVVDSQVFGAGVVPDSQVFGVFDFDEILVRERSCLCLEITQVGFAVDRKP